MAIVAWFPSVVWSDLAADQGSMTDFRAVSAIFEEQTIAANNQAILRESRSLPIESRFDVLSDWSLPNGIHPFRMSAEFIPTEPPPTVDVGGFLVSGAWQSGLVEDG